MMLIMGYWPRHARPPWPVRLAIRGRRAAGATVTDLAIRLAARAARWQMAGTTGRQRMPARLRDPYLAGLAATWPMS